MYLLNKRLQQHFTSILTAMRANIERKSQKIRQKYPCSIIVMLEKRLFNCFNMLCRSYFLLVAIHKTYLHFIAKYIYSEKLQYFLRLFSNKNFATSVHI